MTRLTAPILDERLKKLMTTVRIDDPTTKKGFTRIALFEKAVCEKDEDDNLWEVELTCTQSAMKYIFNLENIGYLRYKLRCITSITSRYSYVMFMYLESNRYRKSWQVELEELKHILNCENEEYTKEFAYFNRDILKKVHKELTEKTECKYEYKPIKKGRKVVAIEFTLQSKALIQEVKPKTIELVDDEIETIKSITNNEFNDQQINLLKTLISHYSSDYKSRIDYLSIKYQEMALYKPKNRFNYLVKMIKNDIADREVEDVIEGQTSIDDYLEDEPKTEPNVSQEEMNELLSQLKAGTLY